MGYELTIQEPSERAIIQTASALRQAGFQVEQSFSLHDCCQYTVLLVYSQECCAPSSVLIHGYDKHTRILLPDSTTSNTELHAAIYVILSSIETNTKAS